MNMLALLKDQPLTTQQATARRLVKDETKTESQIINIGTLQENMKVFKDMLALTRGKKAKSRD